MLILKQLVLLFANCKDADVIITNWEEMGYGAFGEFYICISGSQLDNLSYS